MLIVSPCRATTGSNHTVVVLLLAWLDVLRLNRARMVRRQVVFTVGQQEQEQVLAFLSLLPLPSSTASVLVC